MGDPLIDANLTDVVRRWAKPTTPEELAFLKAQYLGKVTMVDRWLGRLMRKLDEMNLWQKSERFLRP